MNDPDWLKRHEAVNCRMIVAGDGAIPQLIGLVLHPTKDAIVGAIPGTPAARTGFERARELTGYRLVTPEERAALTETFLPGLPGGARLPDGRARRHALEGS